MKQYLKECLEEMRIEITEDKLDKFILYYEMLVDWNSRINLTAITEPKDVVTKHFCDSLSGSFMIKNGSTLADIGTGAGFPGIPLAILRDDISVSLLDSLQKRVNFLNAVIVELGLKNVNAMHIRAEEGSRGKMRDSFDYVTARAVASLNVLCELCLPYVKKGGYFLAYKGKSVGEELSLSQNAISKLSAKNEETYSYTIPSTHITHYIVPIKKIDATLKTYPRPFSKINKSPL